MYPYYTQSQYMQDPLTGKPLPMGPNAGGSGVVAVPPGANLCDYKTKEPPPLDLMTKPPSQSNSAPNMEAASSPLKDFHSSNVAAAAAVSALAQQQQQQHQARGMSHFYPYK